MKEKFDDLAQRVESMLSEGVPREEIVKTIANAGWGVDEFRRANKAGRYNPAASAAMEGMTFGAQGEIRGAIRGGIRALKGDNFLEAYRDEKADSDAALERFRSNHPIGAPLLELGGAAASSMLIPQKRPATLAEGIKQGAKLGGLTGAAYGFNTGEGWIDRIENSVGGGLAGGVVGAALPLASRFLSSLYQAGKSWFPGGAENSATYSIARALQRDRITPQDMMSRITEAEVMGKPAGLADLGGANMRRIGEVAAQSPGEGSQVAYNWLTGRMKEQRQRLTNDVKWAFGTYRSAEKSIDDMLAMQQHRARPLYQQLTTFKAEDSPEVVTAFQEALKTPYGRVAMRQAEKDLLTEYGSVDKVPYILRIDAWKKAIDDKVRGAIRSGGNNQARVMTKLRDRVISTVDDYGDAIGNPIYKQARNEWAGPAQFMDAIEEGGKIKQMSVEEVQKFFNNSNESAKTGFRIGAVSKLLREMGDNPAEAPDLTRVFKSPNMKDKLAAAIPDQVLTDHFLRQLQLEQEMFQTGKQALGNSATARRLLGDEDAKDINVLWESLRDLVTGSWGDLIDKTVGAAGKSVAERTLPARNSAIADKVFNANPEANRQVMQQLMQQGMPNPGITGPAPLLGVGASQLMTDPSNRQPDEIP